MDSPDFCEQGNDVPHWITTHESTPALLHLSNLLIEKSKPYPYATLADIRHWFGGDLIEVKNL
jgi:hypothetical protein